MTYESHEAYRFGEFTLDVDRGALLRDGVEIKLRPKSYEVLRYLVEHSGQLVSRDELLDTVWAGTVVTNDAVTQCLIDVRKALDDQDQEKIRTVTRRGYVFELPVESSTDPIPARGTSTNRNLLLGLLTAAVIAALGWSLTSGPTAPPSDEFEVVETPDAREAIAVLPFADMSPARDQGYFADGVSEEILNMLARRGELRVIARTSSFSFRGKDADVTTIAEQLNVSHVLEGSVRKHGDSLRINVQLIDTATGEYLWTERFDRELSASNLFAVQSEIALAVVDSLPMREVEVTVTSSRLPTESLEALEAYYAGRHLFASRNPVDLERAVELFRRAIEIDPNFALAYVSLADTLYVLSYYGSMSESLADELAWEAVSRALELDSELGEAYATLAGHQSGEMDFEAAEESYRRCLELNPNYAAGYQWYGEFLSQIGRGEEGLEYSRIATELDPRSAIIASDYAEVLGVTNRHDEALRQYDVALAIDPDFYVAYQGKAAILHWNLGRVSEAVPLLESALELAPDSPLLTVYLAEAHLDLGNADAAALLFAEAIELGPDQIWPIYRQIALYVYDDDIEESHASALSIIAEIPHAYRANRVLRNIFLVNGELDKAVQVYETASPELFDDTAEIHEFNFRNAIGLAYVLAQMGSPNAETLLDRVEDFLATRQAPYGGAETFAAEIEAIRGNKEEALALLRAAVDDGWRFQWWWELQHEPAFDVLYDEPEFQEILRIVTDDIARQRASLARPNRLPT